MTQVVQNWNFPLSAVLIMFSVSPLLRDKPTCYLNNSLRRLFASDILLICELRSSKYKWEVVERRMRPFLKTLVSSVLKWWIGCFSVSRSNSGSHIIHKMEGFSSRVVQVSAAVVWAVMTDGFGWSVSASPSCTRPSGALAPRSCPGSMLRHPTRCTH